MKKFFVRIFAKTHTDLRELEKFGLDLKYRAAEKLTASRFVVPGILTEEQITLVKKAGYTVEIIADMDKVAAERYLEVSRVNRFEDARNLREFGERAIEGYMTEVEVESALTSLHTLNPDLITLIELPNRTWENRVCHAVQLRAGTRIDRNGILFTGSMHAREWGGSDICIAFITNLINAYRGNTSLVYGGKTFTAAQVRTILENLDIFVFPDVNPDGKHYSQNHDRWWRKNRNPSVNPLGVDLNRNFDFLWSSGIGTTASPSENYKGSTAFSEPETKNVRYLFDTNPNICYFIDIHSFKGLILYSWGDDNNQFTDPGQNFLNPAYNGTRGILGDMAYREFISTLDYNTASELAHRMNSALSAVRGKSYIVKQACALYPTSGTSDDYAFTRHFVNGLNRKVYSYTIEFGSEFIPPIAEMTNIIKEIAAAMSEFCWAVNSDTYIRDSVADTGTIPSPGEFWDSPDIWVRNADDGGTAHQVTIRGQDNYVHIRINNRGLSEARDLIVRACITNFAGTEFIHPADWIPKNPGGGGSISSPGTYLIGEEMIPVLSAGASTIVKMRWDAALIPPATDWHPCILVEVSPNDGPYITGKHVWENNNLGQKNITVVDARRGTIIRYPFWIGNRFSKEKPSHLVLRKIKAPANAEVFLDVGDPVLLEKLKPKLAATVPAKTIAAAGGAPVTATFLQPVTIALAAPSFVTQAIQPSIILHMPAGARIEHRQEISHTTAGDTGSTRSQPAVVGFELATLGNASLLKISAKTEGKIRIPLKASECKEVALRIAIPKNAAIGDQYEYSAVQYNNAGLVVGGVTLRINVIK